MNGGTGGGKWRNKKKEKDERIEEGRTIGERGARRLKARGGGDSKQEGRRGVEGRKEEIEEGDIQN